MNRRRNVLSLPAAEPDLSARAGLPAESVRLADAIEPLLSQDDLARVLNGSRRTIERMRAAGKLPRPDFYLGKMPRWKPESIRQWIDEQSRKGAKR